jgi:hypothetical protein
MKQNKKQFKYTEPQKRVGILLMKTKNFLHLFCLALDNFLILLTSDQWRTQL